MGILAIGVTMGDPAGIGGEITAKTFFSGKALSAIPVIFCDAGALENSARICGLSVEAKVVSTPDALRETLIAMHVPAPVIYDCRTGDVEQVVFGEVSAIGGRAAFAYIRSAAACIAAGIVAAMVTGPINKESLQAAKVPYIGHTEILAGLTGARNPLTMFETRGLRIFFHSRHVSLRAACDLVTEDALLATIRTCFRELRRLGDYGELPLAVAGLNPHCGEHGLFGDEDDVAVRPAVGRAQTEGYAVVGPIGADSVFHQAKTGAFCAVLSLYHDQGHIAAKTYDFERTISVTLGLPFLRTSVDHGTAFDLAGTGRASPVSMAEAFAVAEKYCQEIANG